MVLLNEEGDRRFQSLSRDSGRLNGRWGGKSSPGTGSFQSLSRDSGRLNFPRLQDAQQMRIRVSIPQSGFGAFERIGLVLVDYIQLAFQSLSRDSGRLNLHDATRCSVGAGCFNPSVGIRGV